MNKPTPGPWQVETGNPGNFVINSDPEDNGKWGAVAEVRANREGSREIDAAEAEANARLMAAAPDLLAALRAILLQVCQGKVLERDACITQARAAIAKAEAKP